MRIAITATGGSPEGPVEPRFGRAPAFLVFDMESGQWEVVDNGVNLDAAQGAGIQAAERIARTGASVLLTGHCGPKAFAVLSQAGVTVYTGASGSVEDAVRTYRSGGLEPAAAPDVKGHW